MEPVGPEQQGGRGVELGAEDVAERDGAPALLDDGDRLRRGEPARPHPGDLLERRRDRPDRAEVGAGADDHLRADVAQPAYRLGEVPDRGRGQHLVGDVVDADQHHGEVDAGGQRGVDLDGQVAGLRADHGEGPEVDPAVRADGEGAGQLRPGRLLDPVDAVARGAGVTEQRDPDRGPGAATAVPAGGVGRGSVAGLADGLARQRRLGAQHAVQREAERGQPAPAERCGGGQLARGGCFPHGATLRTRRIPRGGFRALACAGAVRELAHRPDRQHPAAAAAALPRRARGAAGARQGGVPQPRRVGEGPDRHPDDRGRRGLRRAAAGRDHRRAHVRQHRRRPGDGGPAEGLPLRLRLPRQGQRGQAQRAQGVRRRGGRLPDGGGARAPGLLLQRQ